MDALSIQRVKLLQTIIAGAAKKVCQAGETDIYKSIPQRLPDGSVNYFHGLQKVAKPPVIRLPDSGIENKYKQF
jgi:hypothetical protein